MKIPVDIRVRSERIHQTLLPNGENGNKSETDDFIVSGTMKKTKSGFRIEFNEENDTVTTIINTVGGTVSVNRLGPLNSHMVFADGKAHTCICDTGFFPLHMRVRTKKLENSLSLDGGKLDIDYSVEIVGNLAERNRLTFSVYPDKSIIRS